MGGLPNLVKLADTWKQFFKTHGVSGRPRVQSKSRNGVTFNVCCSDKGTQWIVDDMLNVPGAGRYRMRGSNRYSDWKLTDYTIYKEIGKWYVCLRYKEEVPVEPAYDSKAVGIDLGVDKTVVASDGTVYVENNPNKTKAQKRIKWYQKTLARQQKGSNRSKKTKRRIGRLHKKVANIRTDFAHQTTKKIADTCDVVVMEDLELTNMTKSAKGTVDNPGKNVKAKSGLNRAILDAAPGSIREKLTYKSKKIVLVNPAYTSQTCSSCGHVDGKSRKRSEFNCTKCGYKSNADVNAAINILARGIGVTGQGGVVSNIVELSRRCSEVRFAT